MTVAVVLFLAGLGIGYFGGRELARRDVPVPRGIRRWAQPKPDANKTADVALGDELGESEQLLSASELVSRFGVYARRPTSEDSQADDRTQLPT